MRDGRVDSLARILVEYSTAVKAGDTVVIQGSSAGEPLIHSVYEHVLIAGGHPIVQMSFEGQQATYLSRATDEQLQWVSPTSKWAAEEADVSIAIGADLNTRELSQIPPERQIKRRAATKGLMEIVMERAAKGEHRWVYTLLPTHAYASDAEMSLEQFEGFYFRACLTHDRDPVTAWERQSAETKRLAEWIEGRSEVHVTGPGTDVKLGIEGRKFIAADGKHNMPDGEFFTGPEENSAEGEVSFDLPAVISGREVHGVKLRFESGRVVDASAERGEPFLIELLDTDEGSRRLGELGIGTNYGIERGTKDVLLDEKIGGTVHLAVGMSYPETGGVNDSAVHTDMVCDLRQGGKITVDGDVLQEDGKFVV